MNAHRRLPNKLAMPPTSRAIHLVLALAALLLLHATAFAQFGLGRPSRNPDHPTMSAEFGINGTVWPNRWVPLAVTLTGGDKAFDGILSVTYSQDDRTGSQILRQVAATPGKPSTYHVLVNVPPMCSRVSLVLRSRSGREVSRIIYTVAADPRDGEIDLPTISGQFPIVLGLGSPADPALSTLHTIDDVDDQRHALGGMRPTTAFLSPTLLAPSWAALDSTLVAIAAGEASVGCDPRILAGVREWVSSGGRLVILASGPGNAWRDWLVAPEQPAPIDVAPVQAAPTPDELAETLAWRPPRFNVSAAQSQPATPGTTPAATPIAKPEHDPRYSAAPTLTCRPVSITPKGKQLGWTVRFPIEGQDAAGCVAEGPLGLGWVVVVGFSPDRVATPVLDETTRRVWYALFDNAVGDCRKRQFDATYYYGADQFSAGGLTVSDHTAASARNAALNAISDVPSISHAAFPLLAAGIFILALLIGPLDAVILGRLRSRHRSWATAIGWITIASFAAYLIPSFIRSGNTRVNRLSVIDAVQLSPDPAAPVPAWRTSVTGVFAGKSIEASFKGSLGGSWWRPSSSAHEYYWGPRNRSTPRHTLLTGQTMPDLTALARADDPWGGLGPNLPGAGGNIPTPTSFKIWTFRTFQEQARTTTPLRAHVDAATWTVHFHGLPKDARVLSAVLCTQGPAWRSLVHEPANNTLVSVGAESLKPPGLWGPVDPATAQNQYYAWNRPVGPLRYCLPLQLPGPDRRTWGVERAIERGGAVLYIALQNMPPDLTLDVADVEYQHMQICRLVIPIVGEPPPQAAPEQPPEQPQQDDQEKPK